MAADFDAVYAAHCVQVHHHCVRLVGETEADDLAQRVWVKVWRNLDGFRGEAAMSSWLFRVTRNAAADHARRQRMKKRDALECSLELALETAAPSPLPDAVLLEAQRHDQLHAAIATLRPEWQAALLGWLTGEPFQSQAAAFGIPVGTLKSRVFRAVAAVTGGVSRRWAQQPFVRKSSDSVRVS